MTTVKELIVIERLLLEIENRFKFDLSLEKATMLYDFLKTVGKVTNLFFLLQENHYKKYGDKEKLKEYHDRLANGKIEIGALSMMNFIDWAFETFEDEEFKDIVAKNKFWESN